MERGAAAVACTLLLAFAACLAPASGQGKRPLAGIPRGAELRTYPAVAGVESVSAQRGPRPGGGQGRAAALERLPPGRSGCSARGEREHPSFARPATEQPQT